MKNLDQISEDLYVAERRAELVQKAAKFGTWEWNIDTGALDWDANMMEMYQPKEFTGNVSDFFNSVHPDDILAVTAALDDAVAGQVYNYNFRIITKNDEIRNIHGKGQVIVRNDDGTPHRMLGICILAGDFA